MDAPNDPRPLILEPSTVPVLGRDDHLSPIDPRRLQAGALRARFAAPPPWEPETRGDGRILKGRTQRAASVLLPLIERDGGLTVLLTRRTAADRKSVV